MLVRTGRRSPRAALLTLLAAMVLIVTLAPAQATESPAEPPAPSGSSAPSESPAPSDSTSSTPTAPESPEESSDDTPDTDLTQTPQDPSETPSERGQTKEPKATEEPRTRSDEPKQEQRTQPQAKTSNGVPPDAEAAMRAHRTRLAARGIHLGKQQAKPAKIRWGAQWRFKRGTIYWTRALGAHAVWGAIEDKFRRMGGPTSVLGFPMTDERSAGLGRARFSRFTGGRIFWSPRTGAHEIHGEIDKRYIRAGGVRRFGIPTTDERKVGRARFSVLQEARVYWSKRTGARVLHGTILKKYLRIGGPRAWIGLPMREEFSVPGGRRARFERASIYWRRANNHARIVKAFGFSVQRVSRADVRHTYRSGCPVGPAKLRRLRVVYTNFRGDAALGNIIVRRGVINDLTRVFSNAHRAGFHIRRVRPMNLYKGNDIRAMKADNTSAFNCRNVTGNPYRLSQHSYGNAIDINTFENPYVTSSRVYPAGARPYLNRRNVRKGMIVPGNVVAKTMRNRGWPWGARWSNPDYQHFSSNGG